MKDYFFRKVNPAKDFWIIVEMAHPEIFSFPPFRWIPALIYRISLCFLCLYHQRNSIISYLILISLFLSCDSITLFPLDDGHATFSTSNLRSPSLIPSIPPPSPFGRRCSSPFFGFFLSTFSIQGAPIPKIRRFPVKLTQ